MAHNWWKEPDMGVMTCPVPMGERQGCAAMRMWRHATHTLVAPDSEDAWQQVVDASPPDSRWHSLRNCVAYQAGIWQNLLNKDIDDVIQPAAFKLAIVLRHTPTQLAVRLLSELLKQHPQSQDLTSYILALMTDDEALCDDSSESSSSSSSDSSSDDENPQADDEQSPPSIDSDNEAEAVPVPDDPSERPPPRPDSACGLPDSATNDDDRNQPCDSSANVIEEPDSAVGDMLEGECDEGEGDECDEGDGEEGTGEDGEGEEGEGWEGEPPGPAPLRDLQLYGDLELAVLAASREEYDAHAKLVRAEYSQLSHHSYVELRIKVLNQFSQIPKLFHTPEFQCFEAAARENIEREICTLREHLLTGRRD